MNIISHRGFWLESAEKNCESAFERSITFRYGIETDVRDLCGELVISHDMPTINQMLLEDFFKISNIKNILLAINIKSDGLAKEILECALHHDIENYFAFDMSVPDMRSYLEYGVPVFCRMSEVEPNPPWIDECSGVWLDSFSQEWYGYQELEKLLNTDKSICIVSSELHGRSPINQWSLIKRFASAPNLMLCTDMPNDADYFFNKGVTI
jgi:hypothetical protein